MARPRKAKVKEFLLKLIFGAWFVFFFFDGVFLPRNILFFDRVMLWIISAIVALVLGGIVALSLRTPDNFRPDDHGPKGSVLRLSSRNRRRLNRCRDQQSRAKPLAGLNFDVI
jgi:hypothetical protein